MAEVLALMSSLLYGASDFTSGLMSRRTSAYAITGIAAAVSGVLFLINALNNGNVAFDQTSVTSGIFTGIFLLGGNLTFLWAIKGAPMGVVGGICTLSTLVPVAFASAHGEALSSASMVGVVVVIVGVIMLGVPDMRGRSSLGSLGLALISAVLFGLRSVSVNNGSQDSSFAVLFIAEVVGVVILGSGALVTRSWGGVGRRDLMPIACIGVLNALAFAAYSVATREGNLAVVSVLAGLAPIALAVLAWLIAKEKLAKVQVLALVVVVVGSMLVAVG
ncbi:MAG: EamA family transporter [Actinomycetes bacterium]